MSKILETLKCMVFHRKADVLYQRHIVGYTTRGEPQVVEVVVYRCPDCQKKW